MSFFIKEGIWLDGEKAKDDDRIRKVIKQGSMIIGFLGLEECLTALTGKKHSNDKEAQKLGLKIITFMRNKVESYSNKYNLNFLLMGIEDEILSEEFIALDKSIYGEIKGVTDKNTYTNSFYISKDDNIENKIKIESPYHKLTNGGHKINIKLEDMSAEQLEKILNIMKKSEVGYASINKK